MQPASELVFNTATLHHVSLTAAGFRVSPFQQIASPETKETTQGPGLRDEEPLADFTRRTSLFLRWMPREPEALFWKSTGYAPRMAEGQAPCRLLSF